MKNKQVVLVLIVMIRMLVTVNSVSAQYDECIKKGKKEDANAGNVKGPSGGSMDDVNNFFRQAAKETKKEAKKAAKKAKKEAAKKPGEDLSPPEHQDNSASEIDDDDDDVSYDIDCHGDENGTAYTDNCDHCVGGNTGLEPCTEDCNDTPNGSAYVDACGLCVGGNTNRQPCTPDCNGDGNGMAYIDDCFQCVGGNTGKEACASDCNHEPGGSAYFDDCHKCVGGTTGKQPCSNGKSNDCHGDYGGTAYVDDCGNCVGGNTGNKPCKEDCHGDLNGTAYKDECGTCVGGNTGKQPCAKDCAGVENGTAYKDECGKCVGGTTGNTPCDPCLKQIDPIKAIGSVSGYLKTHPHALLDMKPQMQQNVQSLSGFVPTDLSKLTPLVASGVVQAADIARVKQIRDTATPVIGADYFSVNIKTMPTTTSGLGIYNYILDGNGNIVSTYTSNSYQYTADSLLSYIRMHLNQFIDTSFQLRITPFDAANAYAWQHANTSNGAVLKLTNSSPTNSSTYAIMVATNGTNGKKFTLTTVNNVFQTGDSLGHDVASREFGYVAQSSGYTFYTKGIHKAVDTAAGGILHYQANMEDVLGESALYLLFQKNVAAFVNQNGGEALINGLDATIADFIQVKRAIEGIIPPCEIKPCPTITVKGVTVNTPLGHYAGQIKDLKATKGTAPFIFTLNGNTAAQGGSFTGLKNGDYTVTVTDANTCPGSGDFTIEVVEDVPCSPDAISKGGELDDLADHFRSTIERYRKHPDDWTDPDKEHLVGFGKKIGGGYELSSELIGTEANAKGHLTFPTPNTAAAASLHNHVNPTGVSVGDLYRLNSDNTGIRYMMGSDNNLYAIAINDLAKYNAFLEKYPIETNLDETKTMTAFKAKSQLGSDFDNIKNNFDDPNATSQMVDAAALAQVLLDAGAGVSVYIEKEIHQTGNLDSPVIGHHLQQVSAKLVEDTSNIKKYSLKKCD